MDDIKSKDKYKEKALQYIKKEGSTRPLSFYELKRQLGNDVGILQELVAEDIILEQKVEINGLSSDTSFDVITLYFNKINKELQPKDNLTTTLKRKFPTEESNSQTDPKSVDLNSQIQSLRSRLCELNNIELNLKIQLRENLDIQKTLDNHYRQLHEYNEIKDTGQMLFGKCAEIEGTTTREIYKKFEVELSD
ncbi:17585_t:CDS:2 [Funneliformis caledonium]|uniref:17585_t:CDS:1 n=1 Tax=Funneliformis caledonium TaxID=1117310 RepID=A0A9N9E0M4_9GLOM|nr:17585_t:CDS:2 [Funneliformis caledonium]